MKGGARFWCAVAAHQSSYAVNENAPGADLGSFFEQHTVGLLEFLSQDVPTGEYNTQFTPSVELAKTPPEAPRVSDNFVWRDFEDDDDARFVKQAGPTINKLHSQGGLTAADRTFQQDDVSTRNSAR